MALATGPNDEEEELPNRGLTTKKFPVRALQNP